MIGGPDPAASGAAPIWLTVDAPTAATHLLDPSNRSALIAAVLDHGTDDILDALVERGVLRRQTMLDARPVKDGASLNWSQGDATFRHVSPWREVEP